jgi:hypothetical protein
VHSRQYARYDCGRICFAALQDLNGALALVEIPPEAVSERPVSGGTLSPAAADPLRCGALRLPRLRARLGRDLSWRHATALSTPAHAIAAAGVLLLILVGGLAHLNVHTAEHREPPSSVDTIEAWLRHMTVTRAAPSPRLPEAPSIDVPDRL